MVDNVLLHSLRFKSTHTLPTSSLLPNCHPRRHLKILLTEKRTCFEPRLRSMRLKRAMRQFRSPEIHDYSNRLTVLDRPPCLCLALRRLNQVTTRFVPTGGDARCRVVPEAV